MYFITRRLAHTATSRREQCFRDPVRGQAPVPRRKEFKEGKLLHDATLLVLLTSNGAAYRFIVKFQQKCT